MGCEQHKKTIADREYTYTQLPPKKHLKLKFRLMAIVGESLTRLIGLVSEEDNDKQMEGVGKAMNDIFGKHNPDVIMDLIDSIVSPAFVDVERINIDLHFQNNAEGIYPVLFWILKVEFQEVLTDVQSLLKKQPEREQSTGGQKIGHPT